MRRAFSIALVFAALVAPAPRAGAAEAAGDFGDRFRELIAQAEYAGAESLAAAARREIASRSPVDSLALTDADLAFVEASVRGGNARDPRIRPLAESVVARREAAYGPEDPRVADALEQLARLFAALGLSREALPTAQRALAIREKALDPYDPRLAASCDQVGLMTRSADRVAEAIALLERGLAIRERAFGPESREAAASLMNVGNALRAQGDFARARPMMERSLAIREKVLPPDHPDIALALHTLGSLSLDEGDYSQARSHLERAAAIREKRFGTESAPHAMSLNLLATAIYNSGDLATARALQEQSLAIREKVLGPDHAEVGSSLVMLGNTLFDLGEYDRARPLYERALAIWETTRGPADVAMLTGTLANLLSQTGEREQARVLYERALAATIEAKGPDHVYVADLLYNIGSLFRTGGEFDSAGAYYTRSLAISETAFGPGHPNVASTRNSMAYVDLIVGRSREAFDQAQLADGSGREHFRLIARGLSENEALLYAAVRPKSISIALSAAERLGDAAITEEAWNTLIDSRSLVLDEMARRREARGGSSAEIDSLRADLSRASAEVAGLVVRGPAGDGGAALAAARADKDRIERELARAGGGYRADGARGRGGLAEIRRALPPKSALVAFTRYRRPTRTRESREIESEATDEQRYLAFVLPGPDASPRIVPIGLIDDAEREIAAWGREAGYGTLLAGRSARQAEAEYRAAGDALRKRVWDPLAPLLADAERVFVVPDGSLQLVSFGALPADGDGYLIERSPLIHMLATERELIDEGPAPLAPHGLLAVGGADFDSSGSPSGLDQPRAIEIAAAPAEGDFFRGELSPCRSFRGTVFPPLPASLAEVGRVESIWGAAGGRLRGAGRAGDDEEKGPGSDARALRGADASEDAVKRLSPDYRVLHFATHGFFIADSCGEAEGVGVAEDSRGIAALAPTQASRSDSAARTAAAAKSAAGEPASTTSAAAAPDTASKPASRALDTRAIVATAATRHLGNPLRLSGLALAGANHRSAAGPHEEDGVLTAEEVSSLDLRGVDWAVLSACDTGVGEVTAADGVFGLRRAFQTAGARTVIMSLWAVRDEEALAWMDALYRARYLDGQGTAEAVTIASRSLLSARRAAGQSTHPFHWGGFVASGDWR